MSRTTLIAIGALAIGVVVCAMFFVKPDKAMQLAVQGWCCASRGKSCVEVSAGTCQTGGALFARVQRTCDVICSNYR